MAYAPYYVKVPEETYHVKITGKEEYYRIDDEVDIVHPIQEERSVGW